MKTYIKIAGILLLTLIDTGTLIYVISEDLVKKLRLKIKVNDRIKVAPLEGGSKIRIIGFIPNVLIAIQNFYIPGLLYVMERTELVIILGTDWMDRYQADIRKSDNVMEV